MTPLERAADRVHWEVTNAGRSIDMSEAKALVRTVLLAIREPNEEMVVIGDGVFRNSIRFDKAALAWQAMIDAALEEK